MRISIRGTDKGNALLLALVLIIILSTAVMSLIPRISATRAYAKEYKYQVIRNIEQNNREIINLYDIR
jgi:type II secretory pathway pseudopilin PulG